MQSRLNEIYHRILSFEQVYGILGKNALIDEMLQKIDGPFLIKIDEQYENAKPRVVFVGQENNGWIGIYKEFLEKFNLEYALAHYERFDFENTYWGNFFCCMKNIRESIFGKDDHTGERRSILWSNLFKFNQWNNPQMNWSDYREKVLELQGNIFQQEIEILQPDAIIFVTGPYYDDIITRFYSDTNFIEVDKFSTRSIARLNSKNLPYQTYRTYHPEYAMGKGRNKVPANFYEIIAYTIRTALAL